MDGVDAALPQVGGDILADADDSVAPPEHGGALLAGAAELLLLPLAHAAARTATAAAPPTPVASLAAGDIRFTMELLICLSPV